MGINLKSPSSEYELPPEVRRMRHEVLHAMQNLQSAVDLLSQNSAVGPMDPRARTIVAASQKSLDRLRTFVDHSLART